MPDALLIGRPAVFERGDHVYLTTPLTLASPTDAQVEEYAFSNAVKSLAPNEHIGWLQGRYVEAGRANLNGVMWLSDELALKSMTPMLMPITVMHDPRTAVGTIADCQLVGETEAASTATSRIDTVLAVWKHRFPQIWEEAEANIKDGTMMQSMECFAPSYACSECGQQFVKLTEGKERASWCDHLQHNSSRRILQDVCFTGTGLIFGTRGGTGAYTEAHLDHFQAEVAEFHQQAHVDSTYRPSEATKMGFVQVDETELATLRSDRDKYKSEADAKAEEARTLTTKVEQAEAETAKEKTAREAAEKEAADLKAVTQKTELAKKRIDALGEGFTAKLGEFTRTRLTEAAGVQSDEEWEATLKEKEEMAGVKRDAKKDGDSTTTEATTEAAKTAPGSAFTDEEVASFARGGGAPAQTASTAPAGGVGLAVARAFRPKPVTQQAKS